MTKNKAKNKGIATFLDYLDGEIENYYQKIGSYPKKIKINAPGREKIFKELSELTLDNCWRDFKDNYRGIKIEIYNMKEIKLE